MKKLLLCYESVATLTGCVIGAGILGIPYVVVRSGFWTGVVALIALGLMMLLLNLMLGEVALRTKGQKQLAGYAELYLGLWGKRLMFATFLFSVYGAMIAYTLGVGASLSEMLGVHWYWSAAIFYALMAVLLLGGLKRILASELVLAALQLCILGIVCLALFGSSRFDPGNLVGFSFSGLLVPFGVIIFAYGGMVAVPEVCSALSSCKRSIKSVILWGCSIPLVVYLIFTCAVVGITGGATTPIATIGIAKKFPSILFFLMHGFAVLAMTTSFVALAYALKDLYKRDLALPNWESWALVVAIPALLITLGVQSFTRTLEIAGAISGGIIATLIVAMHIRARKAGQRKPEFVLRVPAIAYVTIVAVFSLGVVYVLSTF